MMITAALGLAMLGQTTPPPADGIKTAPRPSVPVGGFVTDTEARAIFTKLNAVAKDVLPGFRSAEPAIPNRTTPVSRVAVLAEFHRVVRSAEPFYVFTLTPVKFEANRIRVKSPHAQTLVRGGYIAPYGPLTTGTQDRLTARQLGDAIGMFLARMAEVTHTPSTKWTPSLQDNR